MGKPHQHLNSGISSTPTTNSKDTVSSTVKLWYFNIAIENGPCVVHLSIKDGGFSMAMWLFTRGYEFNNTPSPFSGCPLCPCWSLDFQGLPVAQLMENLQFACHRKRNHPLDDYRVKRLLWMIKHMVPNMIIVFCIWLYDIHQEFPWYRRVSGRDQFCQEDDASSIIEVMAPR